MHTADLLSNIFYKFILLLAMDKNVILLYSCQLRKMNRCKNCICLKFNLIFNVLVLDWSTIQDDMKGCVLLVFLTLCSAKPLFHPSHMTLKNMMLKDMEDEGDGDTDPDNSLFPARESVNPFFPFNLFPTCPFGCQCYSRVVHCSDLGKNICQLVLENNVILTKLKE